MSLLLIVLLLDESHLELVEDILKETNFNNKDWEQLGRELGLSYMRQKRINPDNSSILKECLIRWLSPVTASGSSFWPIWFDGHPSAALNKHDPPTLYGLADALESIGYSGASEYIIKTCKLIIMFNDQCY